MQPERQLVRRERQVARRHRHVQLGLRRRSSSRSSTRRRTAASPWSRRRTRSSASPRRAWRCDTTEPDKYYPSGTRNYTRVVAHDAYQGAANAEFAQEIGVKKVFILNDKEAYGLGVATNFRNAAESLGIEIAGFDAWDPKASSYEALYKKIEGTGADGIFIGGLIDENGAQLIKDKVAVLGPNDGTSSC